MVSICFSSVPEEVQYVINDRVYMTFSTSPHPVIVRGRIADTVLIPLLSQCGVSCVEKFFVSHIGDIMGFLGEDLKKVCSLMNIFDSFGSNFMSLRF